MDPVEVLGVGLGIAEAEVGVVAVGGLAHHRERVDLVGGGVEPRGQPVPRPVGLPGDQRERRLDLGGHPIADHEVGDQAEPERGGERGGGDRGPPPRPGAVAAELGEQVIHRREPIAGPHAEPAQHDRAQRAGHPRPGRRWPDLARAHVVAELVERLAAERPAAEQRLVQRDAERELVGARIDVAAVELLGRHVRRGAEHRARRGELEVVDRGARASAPGPGLGTDARPGRGEPEVGHADPAVRADQAVVGLEVAVDDAGGVRGGQPAAGGDVGLDDLGDRVRLLLPLPEAPARDQLHRDVRRAVGDPDVVDPDHVGVVDLRHRPRLADQPIGQRAVGAVQQLERDLAAEPDVIGAVHHAHRPGAEPLDHRVAAEHAARHARRGQLLRSQPHRLRGGGDQRRIAARPRHRHAGQGLAERRAWPRIGRVGGVGAQRVDRGVARRVAREQRDQIAAVGAVVEVRDRGRPGRGIERARHQVLHGVGVETVHRLALWHAFHATMPGWTRSSI